MNAGQKPLNAVGVPEDNTYDPDSWEPNLRFWETIQNGIVLQVQTRLIAPDPDRHIVHRQDLLANIGRENFGGAGRSLLFLSAQHQIGLEVFTRVMQKYGTPFITARLDTTNIDSVNAIVEAFGQDVVNNAILLPKEAELQINEINYTGAAEAHAKYLAYVDDQITSILAGQSLGSNAQSTGLGSGVGNLHGQIREDYIAYDRLCLGNMLRNQLFKQLLHYNGIKGSAPHITWDGNSTAGENVELSNALLNLSNAGIKLEDDSLDTLNKKFGLKFKFDAEAIEPNKPDKSDAISE